MAKSKNLSTKDEAINLLASQYPSAIAANFLEKGFINDLIIEMSYGENGFERKVKDLGLNILIDTKRTPVGEVSGFRGQMFVDSEFNIYITIRGTSTDGIYTLLNNVNTDLSVIANGEFDKEYLKELNDFAKNVRNYSNTLSVVPKIYVHGHSLGGGAAQHVGLLLSMTATEGQSVFTLTSDPIATEELSNKTIAAYKELKANNISDNLDIDKLIVEILTI
jgi:putative lipase involved disintegration of autophagic bodies